ncbi:hypothetical protein D3C78_657020 [compost metagenome]
MLYELARIIAKHIFFLVTVFLGIIVQPKLYSSIIIQDTIELFEQLFLSKHCLVAVFHRDISPLQQLFLERARKQRRR